MFAKRSSPAQQQLVGRLLVKKPINLSQNIVKQKRSIRWLETWSISKLHYMRMAAATPALGFEHVHSSNGNHLIDLFLMLLEIPFPSFPMMRAIFPFVFHLWQGVAVHVPKVRSLHPWVCQEFGSGWSLSGTCSCTCGRFGNDRVTPAFGGDNDTWALVASAVLKIEP